MPRVRVTSAWLDSGRGLGIMRSFEVTAFVTFPVRACRERARPTHGLAQRNEQYLICAISRLGRAFPSLRRLGAAVPAEWRRVHASLSSSQSAPGASPEGSPRPKYAHATGRLRARCNSFIVCAQTMPSCSRADGRSVEVDRFRAPRVAERTPHISSESNRPIGRVRCRMRALRMNPSTAGAACNLRQFRSPIN
jgi:hypothetical protein